MPEIELKDNAWDSVWILASMYFPNDEEMRHQFHTVKFAESELENTVSSDFIEMEAEVIQTLIDSPGKREFREIVGKQTRDAIIAGNVLATVYAMDSFPYHFDEPSERKAIFVAQKFAERSQYGDGSIIPRSEPKIRQCMESFRSVAHLWAAWTLHEGYPMREQKEILASPRAIEDFLGIAGNIQDFGCGFAPDRPRDRDRKTILDLETIWSVPASIKRLKPPWTSPPTWVIDTLKEYRAT